jgi:hypothetical protein
MNDKIYFNIRVVLIKHYRFNVITTCSELSSGIYCRVKLLSTDVSEVRTASIIPDDNSEHAVLLPYVLIFLCPCFLFKGKVSIPDGGILFYLFIYL